MKQITKLLISISATAETSVPDFTQKKQLLSTNNPLNQFEQIIGTLAQNHPVLE
jgi:hypothetical protein